MNIQELADDINKNHPEYVGAKLISTYLIQDAERWERGKKACFKEDLKKACSGEGLMEFGKHFAYIKFYIDKSKEIRPLVVGKTNYERPDVIFDKIDDGRCARRFLCENNLEWHMTEILVVPARNRAEAYKIEGELKKTYGLLSS